MSTLFMIGNGFDLNCGMNTRFSDVYQLYLKNTSNSEVIQNFKSNISGNIEKWSDFEMAMAAYANELHSEEELLECIRDFSVVMERHLKDENNRIKQVIKENKNLYDTVIEEFGKSLELFYAGISHNVNREMSSRGANRIADMDFLTFNYTDFLDELVEGIKYGASVPIRVVHIHGKLGDDPILGVDNESQLIVPYELSIAARREFIKPYFNQQYDQARVGLAERMMLDATTICTFGMSLGESDLSWRNNLMGWIKSDNKNHLFLFYKKYSDLSYRTKGEQMQLEDEAKKEIIKEWNFNAQDDVLERIHVPCGRNIFNIGRLVNEAVQRYESVKNGEVVIKKLLEKEKL